jgi:hypothetical protein
MTRTTLRIGAALLGGSALAVAVPALAAVSNSSPPAGVAISIQGTGALTARGAQVTVPFTVTCPAQNYGTYLYGTLSEKVGGGVASNNSSTRITCTNVPETVTLTFTAQSGGKAFKAGTAALNATLESYTRKGYVVLPVDGSIKLVSK